MLKSLSLFPSSILQLVVPALIHLELPKDLSQRKTLLQLDQKPKVKTAMLEFLLCYLLLPYGYVVRLYTVFCNSFD